MPLIPDYRSEPQTRPPGVPGAAIAVAGGLLGGMALSAAFYWLPLLGSRNFASMGIGYAFILIGFGKLVAVSVLLGKPGRLSFTGIGPLLSMPLGGLIFTGACFHVQ